MSCTLSPCNTSGPCCFGRLAGGGGAGLAAFVLRYVLFFEEGVVDVLVVQVVDMGSSSSWTRSL